MPASTLAGPTQQARRVPGTLHLVTGPDYATFSNTVILHEKSRDRNATSPRRTCRPAPPSVSVLEYLRGRVAQHKDNHDERRLTRSFAHVTNGGRGEAMISQNDFTIR